MQIEAITHTGLVRPNNEDRYLVLRFGTSGALAAIADGMGGHAGGETAAQIALETLAAFDSEHEEPAEALTRHVISAHENILHASAVDRALRGMGSTLSIIFVSGRTAYWASVGDSRIYLFRNGVLTPVSNDHTIPGSLLKEGKITREQARLHPYGNVLLRCVGCDRHEPDRGTFEVNPGDLLMLSSDGLHDLLSDGQIAEVLSEVLSSEESLTAKLQNMLSMCLELGGRDNITAVLMYI